MAIQYLDTMPTSDLRDELALAREDLSIVPFGSPRHSEALSDIQEIESELTRRTVARRRHSQLDNSRECSEIESMYDPAGRCQ